MDYAAVMVRSPISNQWELMSSGGRVIVFDTAAAAWEWLPLLGQGRTFRADSKTHTLHFYELSNSLPNLARVVSPYLPEEKMPWKRHVIWTEWWGGRGRGEI